MKYLLNRDDQTDIAFPESSEVFQVSEDFRAV